MGPFGTGKTHSIIALYHLLDSPEVGEEEEIEQEELEKERERDLDDLENRLRKRYGRAYRFTKENELITRSVKPDVSRIKSKLRADQPEIRDEIKESAERGKRGKQKSSHIGYRKVLNQ